MAQRGLQEIQWHPLIGKSSSVRMAQALSVYTLRDASLTRKTREEGTDVRGLKGATL